MRFASLAFGIATLVFISPVSGGQPKPRVLTGPKGTPWAIAFSPDGKLVAAACDVSEKKKNDMGMEVTHVKGSEVLVWDLQKGEVKKTFEQTMQAGALAFSPDGKLLAIGSFKEIRLADMESGQVKHTLKDFDGSAKGLAFSADGKTLYSANSWFAKSEIRLWDSKEGKLVKTITDADKVEFTGLSVSGDGKVLATSSRISEGGFSGQVKIWDVAAGTVKQTITDPVNWINNVALSPDGKTVAAPTQFTISIWDAQNGKLVRSIKEFVTEIHFAHGGATLVGNMNTTGGSDVRFIDAKTGRVKQTVKVKHEGLAHFALSPDSKWLACGSGDAGKGEVQLVDVSKIK